MATHYLTDETVHYLWDVANEPALIVDSGDVLVVRTRDVSDGQLSPGTTTDAIANLDWERIYPLAGPIAVNGAAPGDVLAVDVLDVRTVGWGWAWVHPGLGLLPDDFDKPYLRIFEFPDAEYARLREDIAIPVRPFLGVMGVCPHGADGVGIMPPGSFGGNLDIRQLTRGATLYLPVQVPGALFSCGDAHAAQGDGEVCVCAIEAPMYAALRLTLHTGRTLPGPQFELPRPASPTAGTAFYATTGIGDDLFGAAQQATRAMIDHLGERYELSREDAYLLTSLGVDLRISEVVNAGHFVVSAFLPLDLFRA